MVDNDILGLDEMQPHQFLRVRRIALGLTQKDVAERIGTTQSAVAAIESDKRRMSPAMEAKLRGALRAHPAELLAKHREQVLAEAEKLGFEKVRVFGSLARGEATEDSDIDLLVDRVPGTRGAFRFWQLERRLENLLSIRVDVKPVPRTSDRDRRTNEAIADAVAV